ncbi:hypothetical protein PRUPE_1G468000 [Prunus persica]|uniref:Uncharacterized protein n=1 Tax=Prunus persica TaxID=3760 RepID=M5XG28_PRUPE|nr:hypothetical protein PRUPE_1G468000 [Prunus persica]
MYSIKCGRGLCGTCCFFLSYLVNQKLSLGQPEIMILPPNPQTLGFFHFHFFFGLDDLNDKSPSLAHACLAPLCPQILRIQLL